MNSVALNKIRRPETDKLKCSCGKKFKIGDMFIACPDNSKFDKHKTHMQIADWNNQRSSWGSMFSFECPHCRKPPRNLPDLIRQLGIQGHWHSSGKIFRIK